MLQTIWWLVAPPTMKEIPNPVKYVTLFIYELKSKGNGAFTAYHAIESSEEYWNEWLKRRDDRDPSNLLDSMPMCLAKTGYLESEEQFQQLLREIGRVSK